MFTQVHIQYVPEEHGFEVEGSSKPLECRLKKKGKGQVHKINLLDFFTIWSPHVIVFLNLLIKYISWADKYGQLSFNLIYYLYNSEWASTFRDESVDSNNWTGLQHWSKHFSKCAAVFSKCLKWLAHCQVALCARQPMRNGNITAQGLLPLHLAWNNMHPLPIGNFRVL